MIGSGIGGCAGPRGARDPGARGRESRVLAAGGGGGRALRGPQEPGRTHRRSASRLEGPAGLGAAGARRAAEERKGRTLGLPPLGHFLLRSRTAEVSASQWFPPRPPAEVCARVTSDTLSPARALPRPSSSASGSRRWSVCLPCCQARPSRGLGRP